MANEMTEEEKREEQKKRIRKQRLDAIAKGKQAAMDMSPELVASAKERRDEQAVQQAQLQQERIRKAAPQFANYKRSDEEAKEPSLMEQGLSWAKKKFPTLRSQAEVEAGLQERAKLQGTGLTDSWRQDPRIKRGIAEFNQSREMGNIEQQMDQGAKRDAEMQPSKDMGDIEYQMAGGEQRDIEQENQRNQAEEFLANASEEEQEEVIATTQEHTGTFSEQTAAAKEATGRYVRYDGATKQGITINKSYLEKLHDRKGKMALLQHIPQENRAALLFNWGLISPEDLSDTQQQSAKEVLELEKINLQIAELKNKTGKLTDTEKAQVTAASNGLAQAVKERRWVEAEGFQDQLNALMPDRKPLDFEKMQKAIDKKLLERPKLQKVKELMGTQVWDGYFEFKNDLVKKIDLLKRSTAGSGELAKFLGGTIDTGEHQGKTWSDVLEGQGVPSWKTVEGMNKDSAKAKEIASRISGGKHEDITRISRGKYMGHVLPQMRQMIMKEQYGEWYTTIEKELHGAQNEATTEAQESVNSDGVPRPEPTVPEAEPEADPYADMVTGPQEYNTQIPPDPDRQMPQGSPSILGQQTAEPTPPRTEEEKTEAALKLQQEQAAKEAAELAEQKRREKEGEELYPKWKKSEMEIKNMGKIEKAEWKKFKKWIPNLLEKSKDDPKFLKNLEKKYKESLKRKKAKGKKHYWEDYNLAYIKMLLNK